MDQLLDTKYGVAGILVTLVLNLLIQVAKFLWSLKEKKDLVSDDSIKELTKSVCDNTKALQSLEMRLSKIEEYIAEFPKIKSDVRKSFQAIKIISGENWPEIRKQIEDDFFL